MTTPHRIAVLAGDGIGQEVMPEGLRVLDAAARRFGIPVQVDEFDFAHCRHFERHGKMMPDDWKDLIGGHEAIFFGAVGWPATVPDHVSLWGSLLGDKAGWTVQLGIDNPILPNLVVEASLQQDILFGSKYDGWAYAIFSGVDF